MTLTNFPNGLSVAGYAPAAGATITVGAEAGGTINVAVQLTDGAGDALTTTAGVLAYISDDSDGSSVAATAPDAVAIGTDGLAIPLVAGKTFLLVSEADGDIDIDIDEAAADTFYLVIVLPSGELVISDAITFPGA